MKLLFSGQVPKEASYPDTNEDKIELAPEIGRIAISDGASESFDSKTWAQILTTRFVQHPNMIASWLDDAISDYIVRFDPARMSWSKKAAFDRGSFATLLGIEQHSEDGTVEVLGIGDSLAVYLDNGVLVASFPYVCAQEFQRRPELLSTNAAFNVSMTSLDFVSNHRRTWTLADKTAPVVLCMTDALGEWALRQTEEGRSVWQTLAGIRDVADLESLVVQERQTRSMRSDDTTLVTLAFMTAEIDALPNA